MGGARRGLLVLPAALPVALLVVSLAVSGRVARAAGVVAGGAGAPRLAVVGGPARRGCRPRQLLGAVRGDLVLPAGGRDEPLPGPRFERFAAILDLLVGAAVGFGVLGGGRAVRRSGAAGGRRRGFAARLVRGDRRRVRGPPPGTVTVRGRADGADGRDRDSTQREAGEHHAERHLHRTPGTPLRERPPVVPAPRTRPVRACVVGGPEGGQGPLLGLGVEMT